MGWAWNQKNSQRADQGLFISAQIVQSINLPPASIIHEQNEQEQEGLSSRGLQIINRKCAHI